MTTPMRPTHCPTTCWSPSPSFFRDPEAFDALREQLAAYLDRPDTGEVLRVWVPGLRDRRGGVLDRHAGERDPRPSDRPRPPPQDLRDRPRRREPGGRPPRRVSPVGRDAHPGEPLREAYTQETSEGFQIADVLRECTVFARHDVGTRPALPADRPGVLPQHPDLLQGAPPGAGASAIFGFALRRRRPALPGQRGEPRPHAVGLPGRRCRPAHLHAHRPGRPAFRSRRPTRPRPGRRGPAREPVSARARRHDSGARAAGQRCWRRSCVRPGRRSSPWTTTTGSSRSSATSARTAAWPRAA